MRTLVLLAVLSVALTSVVLAPTSDASAFCSNAVSSSCGALVCVPNGHGGQLCSKDFNPQCFTEPCPGLP